MNMREFSVITSEVVRRIVGQRRREIVQEVRRSYLVHESGGTVNPDSYFLHFLAKPDSKIIALPAYLGGDHDVAGIKWIASFPENISHGIPRASAVLLLNDYETGYPFTLPEAVQISAARTVASAVLAAEYLAARHRPADHRHRAQRAGRRRALPEGRHFAPPGGAGARPPGIHLWHARPGDHRRRHHHTGQADRLLTVRPGCTRSRRRGPGLPGGQGNAERIGILVSPAKPPAGEASGKHLIPPHRLPAPAQNTEASMIFTTSTSGAPPLCDPRGISAWGTSARRPFTG